MLSTPHILVGGAIVKIIPNPIISLPLAILSHFLFDFIPHWDFKITLKPRPLMAALIDYVFGLALLYAVSSDQLNQLLIMFGGIGATGPDFLMGGARVLNIKFLKSNAPNNPSDLFTSRHFRFFLNEIKTS